MMMKTLGPLMCLGFLLMLAGCSVHRPHGKMRMREAPVVTSEHFRVYDAEGKPSAIDDIVRAAITADVVLIGEEHGDPVGHYLELQLLKRFYEAFGSDEVSEMERRVVLSMEMFERDVQTVLDEYLGDLITERHFIKAARPWPAYRTDYRPLIEFAKAEGIPVVAANAPGRYVNRVARLGRSSLDHLFPASKGWLPPLPYGEASPRYREKFETFWEKIKKEGGAHGPAPGRPPKTTPQETRAPSEKSDAFLHLMDAQSLWDASMAWSLAESLRQHPGALAIHVNGKFHSEYGLGIPEHLRQYRPDLSFLTVTILSLPSFPAFDPTATDSGTFIIVTDPSLEP
jgi:uncharacterized iron-regulated protein